MKACAFSSPERVRAVWCNSEEATLAPKPREDAGRPEFFTTETQRTQRNLCALCVSVVKRLYSARSSGNLFTRRRGDAERGLSPPLHSREAYNLPTMSEFTVDIEREEDGRWIGEVAELPGVLTYGVTREEAV